MRVEVKINANPVNFFQDSFGLNSQLSQRVSTADFDIEGEERFETPSLAIGKVTAIGGYTMPITKQEVKIDRGAAPFENCAISDAIALGGASTYIDHFLGGYIASVEPRLKGVRKYYRCSADDYNGVLHQIVVNETYAIPQTEAQILADLFSKYWPDIDTSTYVTGPTTVASIQFPRIFLDEAIEQLATLYGREWYIDHEKKFHYFTTTTTEAPFQFSDEPYLSIAVGYSNFEYKEDASELCNRIIIVGRTALGVDIIVTRTNSASYAKYGRYFDDKKVDRNINTTVWAENEGDAILSARALPKVSGSLVCNQEGLVVGQKVKIINRYRNINGYYLVQSLQLSMIGAQTPQIRVAFGDYSPDLVKLLGGIKKESQKEA